jgi:hypothetical protein
MKLDYFKFAHRSLSERLSWFHLATKPIIPVIAGSKIALRNCDECVEACLLVDAKSTFLQTEENLRS